MLHLEKSTFLSDDATPEEVREARFTDYYESFLAAKELRKQFDCLRRNPPQYKRFYREAKTNWKLARKNIAKYEVFFSSGQRIQDVRESYFEFHDKTLIRRVVVVLKDGTRRKIESKSRVSDDAPPKEPTLEDVGVSRRVDLDREEDSSHYMFPTWLDVLDVDLDISSSCNPFSADIPAGNGELKGVCYIDGDKNKPLALGVWDPEDYFEQKDAYAEGNIVWRYWKVRYDEKLVSLSRYDPESYDLVIRIPGKRIAGEPVRWRSHLTTAAPRSFDDTLCQENPGLGRASFQVTFTPDDGTPAKTRLFAFQHCSISGRIDGPAMEADRIYASPDHDVLSITTRSGSRVSGVSLTPGLEDGAVRPLWDAELGDFFTERLLSGEPVAVERTVLSIAGDKVPGSLILQSRQ
jgi:hypothetical protein